MRWLGQIVQVIIFILLVGGLMAYIADRTEQQDASERCLRCRELWDPNHLLVESSDQILLRRQEMESLRDRLPAAKSTQGITRSHPRNAWNRGQDPRRTASLRS